MPAPLVAMWENVDRGGTHGAVFTKQLTKDGMVDGIAGILTDYVNSNDPTLDRSRASAAAIPGAPLDASDEAALGLRPYFVKYRADDVFKTVYQTVNGVKTLVLLILRNSSDERIGRFGVQTVFRYRIYTNTNGVIQCEVWKRAATASQAVLERDALTLTNVTKIPWSPLIAGDEVDANETRPPLDDLADLNVEHFQVKTNIRNLESLALVPTMVRVGAQRDENGVYPTVTLGPRTTIEAPAAEGVTQPLYWLTPDTTVLQPANTSLEKIEQQMGAAGLAFLSPDTRAAETAEAKRIDANAQNASLRSVARAVQDCLESAFGFAGQYIKQPAGSVSVNADFEETVMEPAMIAELRALAVAGKLSIETLLGLLEKGHVLDEGFDVEEEKRRILTENADTLKSMGVGANGDQQGDGGTQP
jgi:hypothetical protein